MLLLGAPGLQIGTSLGGRVALWGGAQRLQVCRGPPKFANWHISGGKSSLVVVGGGTEIAGMPRPSGRLEGLVEAGLGCLLASRWGAGSSDSTPWRFTYAFLSAQDVGRIHQLREHL